MGIGEFLFGKGQEQPIDKIKESEQNIVNQEDVLEQPEQEDLFKEALKKEKAMVEQARGRRKLAAVFGLASTLLASPVYGQDIGAEFTRGLFELGRDTVRELGSTARNRQDEETRRHEADRRFDERKVEAGTRERESDNRRSESEHRDDSDTRQRLGTESERTQQRKIEVGGRVTEVETQETETSRRHMSDRGVYELSHKTENTGAFGNNRRERSGDSLSIDQMRAGGVPTSPLPSEERVAEHGGGRELSEAERDALAVRAVKDYEKGVPSPDFASMPEEEREVYGHAWNNIEKNIGKTGIILRPPRG